MRLQSLSFLISLLLLSGLSLAGYVKIGEHRCKEMEPGVFVCSVPPEDALYSGIPSDNLKIVGSTAYVGGQIVSGPSLPSKVERGLFTYRVRIKFDKVRNENGELVDCSEGAWNWALMCPTEDEIEEHNLGTEDACYVELSFFTHIPSPGSGAALDGWTCLCNPGITDPDKLDIIHIGTAGYIRGGDIHGMKCGKEYEFKCKCYAAPHISSWAVKYVLEHCVNDLCCRKTSMPCCQDAKYNNKNTCGYEGTDFAPWYVMASFHGKGVYRYTHFGQYGQLYVARIGKVGSDGVGRKNIEVVADTDGDGTADHVDIMPFTESNDCSQGYVTVKLPGGGSKTCGGTSPIAIKYASSDGIVSSTLNFPTYINPDAPGYSDCLLEASKTCCKRAGLSEGTEDFAKCINSPQPTPPSGEGFNLKEWIKDHPYVLALPIVLGLVWYYRRRSTGQEYGYGGMPPTPPVY